MNEKALLSTLSALCVWHQSRSQSPLAFGQRVVASRNAAELEFYLNVLIGCPVTALNGSIVLPQKTCGNKITLTRSLYWRPPAD